MIKILSGKYKGRKLNNFSHDHIRPTQAKVKKSMMDTLMPFQDKTILDLFSGVGSLGIEAISRGAQAVCFVDNNPKAINILKKNLKILNLEEEVIKIKFSDVFKYLDVLHNDKQKFDIVIADPPYYKFTFEDMKNMVEPILSNSGVFCYESDKSEIDCSSDLKIKRFGNTQLTFWRKI